MIVFIRLVLRLLNAVSEDAAAALLFHLIAFPRRRVAASCRTADTGSVQRITFDRNGPRTAWQWGAEGPLVICVHGWEGCGLQFAPIGNALAAAGCRCVAPDLTAHGDSSGRRARFSDFVEDVGALHRHLGEPVAAGIGHSAGGMVLMAAAAETDLSADRCVVMASPIAPLPAVEMVRRILDPPDSLIRCLQEHLGRQFSCTWSELTAGALYSRCPASRLLLVYDGADTIVPVEHGDRIQTVRPDARSVRTRGLGHNRILRDPDVIRETIQFVRC